MLSPGLAIQSHFVFTAQATYGTDTFVLARLVAALRRILAGCGLICKQVQRAKSLASAGTGRAAGCIIMVRTTLDKWVSTFGLRPNTGLAFAEKRRAVGFKVKCGRRYASAFGTFMGHAQRTGLYWVRTSVVPVRIVLRAALDRHRERRRVARSTVGSRVP